MITFLRYFCSLAQVKSDTMQIKSQIISLLFLCALVACEPGHDKELTSFRLVNDSIKSTYAPDKRVAIYDIEAELNQDKVILRGQTDQPKALEDLKSILASKGIVFEDKVVSLPDSSVGDNTRAIVNNSVANIRSQPRHSAELATQAILGTVLKVLKIQGDFYLVQTPDGYIAWVDHGGVTLASPKRFDAWTKAPKIIFTRSYGSVYDNPGDELIILGDLVLGAQLVLLDESDDFYKVQYPDERVGFVKKSESERYHEWIEEVDPSGTLVELYARELMGSPYLWGGTSSKGMDCSGFTKTVYLMNGYVIPRDASQQINAGKNVDEDLNMSHLEKGDLMFFGTKATDSTRQRVTHVGIWLGNDHGEFIHASGKVKMSSIDPNAPDYDAFNTNRYLGSRRYLGQKDVLIKDLKQGDRNSKVKS